MSTLQGQSVFDYLVILVPEVTQKIDASQFINPKVAKDLFNIWKDENNRIDSHSFKRPLAMSSDDIAKIEREGLVKSLGDRIEITSKGEEVIRVMVLGDDRSTFESKDGSIIDYSKAIAASKANATTAGRKSLKCASSGHEDQWWKRFIGS